MPDTISTKSPTPNNLDVLIVKNIDIDCTVQDTDDDYNHSDYFQVRWSGHPHRIVPGQTKKMPRFLAEHYAKHLADHVLMRMEEKTGRKGLIQSSFERPKIIKEILLGVDTWYMADSEVEQGEKVAKMVDTLNPEERPVDLGTIPDPLMGILKAEPKSISESVSEVTENVVMKGLPDAILGDKPSIWDDSKPRPSRKELLADCEKLGIEVSGKENVQDLIDKIKKF